MKLRLNLNSNFIFSRSSFNSKLNSSSKSRKSSSQAGFTLLEIIIVIMIIGGVISLAIGRVSFNKPDNRKVFREFVIAVKEIRNRAKLYNATYRMAFKLDEKNQSWWVEKGESNVLIDVEKLKDERENTKIKFSDDKPEPSPFSKDTSFMKKEKTLPDGYVFKSLESGPQDSVFTTGMAYINFFSTGMIEPVALQITDPKKNTWTLVFNTITGQADIIEGEKSLKDLNR